MPRNNPERERVDGGDTVFIDTTALSELSPQLMQQDLETLVGLNIHTSDLESLHVASDGQVADTSSVLISDGLSVGNIVEVSEEEIAMNTSTSLASSTQPMEIDSLADSGHVLSEMDMLHHGHEFIPISGNEELMDVTMQREVAGLRSIKSVSNNTESASLYETATRGPISQDLPQTQILKTSAGQFVILQPNQTSSLPISSLNSKMFSSSNLILSSLNSTTANKGMKQSFVNANQIGASPLRQIGNLNQNQTQFRTVQLKQPVSISSDSHNSGVTKVILTSQPGNNLSQQLRLISSQANAFSTHTNSQSLNSGDSQTASINSSTSGSPKLAFQFQPFGLSLSTSKNITQSPVKAQLNDVKPSTNIKVPLNTATSLQHFATMQSSDGVNQIISTTDSKPSSTGHTAQNVVLKSMPSSNATNLKPGQIFASSGPQLIRIPVSQLSQLNTQGQTVQLTNKMNFRIVSSNAPSTATAGGGANAIFKSISVAAKPAIAPTIYNNNNNNNSNNNRNNSKMKSSKLSSTIPIQINHLNPKQQRLLIPINNQDSGSGSPGIQIRPQKSITLPASALPPGVLSNAQPGSLVMIPAQYFQNASGLSNHVVQASGQHVPVSIATTQSKNMPTKTVIDANVIKARKPCNCTKSQCLKLYCDCFANGEFCNNCNCINCYNNLTHEEERQKAIKCCLERNPSAFRPKIGKGGSDSERRHNKGCNCKRSGCLKNYCECYEAKIPCSNMCKCVGCRNMDTCEPLERKRLMELAEAAESRVNHHMSVKSRPLSLASLPSPAKMSLSQSVKNSYCRISQEVVEATCHCLLAQAEKVEKGEGEDELSPREKMEVMVINEFSRCLLQIIGFNSKAKGS